MHSPSRLLRLLPAAALVAACVGKSPSSDPIGLTSGTYVYANSALPLNDCNLVGGNAAAFDGVAQTVTVSGPTLTFDVATDPIVVTTASTPSFDAPFAGVTFAAATVTRVIDWTTTAGQLASGLTPLSQGYACSELDTYDVSGTVTGRDQFSRVTDVNYTMVAGTADECIAANNSAFTFTLTAFPCESRLTEDAAR